MALKIGMCESRQNLDKKSQKRDVKICAKLRHSGDILLLNAHGKYDNLMATFQWIRAST